MEGRMSRSNRTPKDKSGNERTAQRQKRKAGRNISNASSSSKAGERLPIIGSRATEKSAITAQAGKRNHVQPPVSVTHQSSFMAPWEGSSISESSFTSIPSAPPIPFPPSPRPPPSNTSSKTSKSPNPPHAIRDSTSDNRQSVGAKRRLLPLRGPSRPPHLPPLRKVTNLSFSRSFTFSFFELPWHQSVQNRADRLKELVVILRKIQY